MDGLVKDAVFNVDGTLADGPIALFEVQGYIYAAKQRAAERQLYTLKFIWIKLQIPTKDREFRITV